MVRSGKRRVVLLAGACLMAGGPARATCAYYDASYQGGAFGAYAVTQGYCYAGLDQEGGALSTTASALSVLSTPYTDASSSATLSSGGLTVYSAAGSASASLWDTFTYSGLPTSGASILVTLSLPGTLTGNSMGYAKIQEGSETDLSNGSASTTYTFFDNTSPIPPSISLTFNAMNGVPETVFTEITGFGDGIGGIVDLADPPMLSLTVPNGASVATASGVFGNFILGAVPEPSTWAMVMLGFAGLGCAAVRTRRPARATA